MRASTRLNLAAFLTGAAFGQVAANQPVFEVADVHVSASSANQFVRGPMTGAGRYELRSATMVDLVAKAYGVDPDRVLGGPSWLEYDRFDVIAKTPPNTSAESAKLMLQALLAERFKLVAHKDTQPMAAFALTVGKGNPKLKQADGSGDTGCKFTLPPPPPPPGPGQIPAPPTLSFNCHNMTMAAFAEGMRTMAGAAQFLGTSPVLDKTGLEGSWDFSFKFSLPLRGLAGAVSSDNTTLLDALDKQLGLKLEPIKVPFPVMMVESVNQKPTQNLLGVTEKLPAPPTEFEVAEVKPTAPDFKGVGIQIQPGGRVNIGGAPLKFLIQQAWSISNDMIVGAPKWTDTDRYDIIAKPPLEGGPGPVYIDDIWIMLRALLAERFKLATHLEERPMTAYTLIAVKPKLKKADPSSRTKWTEGPGASGKDPRNTNPALSRLVTVQNMTMAQFAEKLQYIAPGYIHSAVVDATGLQGGYDFTLSFSPAGLAQVAASGRGGAPMPDAGALLPGPGPAETSQASDPNGAIPLLEAIEKQLGLKLEAQKRPVPVLVIDHIEQQPAEN